MIYTATSVQWSRQCLLLKSFTLPLSWPCLCARGETSRLAQELSAPRFWLAFSVWLRSYALEVLHVRKTPVVAVCGDNSTAEGKQKLSPYPTQCGHDAFYCHGLVTTANLMQLASTSPMGNTGPDRTEKNTVGGRKGKETSPFEGMSGQPDG